MSAGTYLSVLRAIEQLYESVVMNPAGWNEQAFADWAGEALGEAAELPKEAIREVRRCLRAGQKMQAFWLGERSAVSDHDDWRSRVDIALGPRAWRPTLALARVGLEDAPDEELYEEVKARFAIVNSERWMDGVDFDQWMTNS